MELRDKISKSKFSELEKKSLYSTLEKIKTPEDLNKFKEDVEGKLELLEKDVESYKVQAKKLIDENKILSKEDKEYYYKRLKRAKTSTEVKKIIDEIADGGAETLVILMEKKAEAKKELDKLSLRENSKDYYIRLIDGAVSLNEVDEVLEMAKNTPDGSKLLLKEKELTREKLQKINNLTDQEKEKYLEDIYYAMEVRELDEIIKLAQSQGTENLDKAKENAKKEIAELEYLGKENSSKIIEEVNEKTLIEEVEKTLERARKLNDEMKAEKELNETKDSLVAKVKELKYLTEAKTSIYIRSIQNAETIELAENIYNRAAEENTKLEQIAKDNEKEELEEELRAK
ncbi:MAG: hypothetical protein ACLT39_09205, partial [Peptoniphilus sp.]